MTPRPLLALLVAACEPTQLYRSLEALAPFACVESTLDDGGWYRSCREVAAPDACAAGDTGQAIVEVKDAPCDRLTTISGGWSAPVEGVGARGLWRSASSGAWIAVGARATIWGTFETRRFEPAWDLNAVWATSLEDVIVAGDSLLMIGSVLANEWYAFEVPSNLTAIAGPPGDVWIAGSGGTILRWSGAELTELEHDFDVDLNAVWVAPDGQAWIAGDGGLLLHWDGTALEVIDLAVRTHLRGVAGTSPADLWVVGDGTLAMYFDGSTWTREVPVGGTEADFSGVLVLAPDDVHVASNNGLFRWNGFELRQRREGSYAMLHGLLQDDGRRWISAHGENKSDWEDERQSP